MSVSLTQDDAAFCLLFGRQCRQHYGNEAWEDCVRKLRSCWAHVTDGRNLAWETVESQVRLGWESMVEAEPPSLRWGGN